MKNQLRSVVALVAFFFVVAAGRAQVTYDITSDTTTTYGNPFGTFYSPAFSAVQTFTGFSSINDMTWLVQNTSGTTANSNFNAYIYEWDAANNNVVSQVWASAPVSTTIIPINGTASLDFVTDTTALALDPTTTYALILSMTFGGSNGGFSGLYSTTDHSSDSFFGSGQIFAASTATAAATFETDLTDPATFSAIAGSGWAMSVSGTLSPVPEPRETALMLAALFVAVLIGRQMWLRQKAALQPIPVRVA